MTGMRRHAFGLAALAMVCGLAATAQAEVTVELSGVPDNLRFPVAQGANLVLTATVGGADVDSVWLAADRDARGRVLLSPAGNGRYHINLADPVVGGMLGARGEGGQFRVFAQTADGRIAGSIPVRFAVTTLRAAPSRVRGLVHVYVHAEGKRHEAARRIWDRPVDPWDRDDLLYMMWEGPYGSTSQRHRRWFRPEDVSQIEVRLERAAPDASAEALVGRQRLGFEPDDTGEALRLAATPAVHAAWREAGELTVRYVQGGSAEDLVTLRVPPDVLDLPGESARVTVIQRYSKALPGSDGYLRLRIGDITGGQTLLTLSTADGRTLIDQESVRLGDEVTFQVAETKYVLAVDSMINFLIGDDYAEFVVSEPYESEHSRIRRLINSVRESAVVLIRGGREYSPLEGSQHLRSKFAFVKDEVRTLEDFITRVGSRSWLTGEPYQVRLPDGETLPAEEWLRQRAAELAEPAEPAQAD